MYICQVLRIQFIQRLYPKPIESASYGLTQSVLSKAAKVPAPTELMVDKGRKRPP